MLRWPRRWGPRGLGSLALIGLIAALPANGGRLPRGGHDGGELPHGGAFPHGSPADGPQQNGEQDHGEPPRNPAAQNPSLPAPTAVGSTPAHPSAIYAPNHIVAEFANHLPEWQRRQIAQAAGGISFKALGSGRLARIGLAPGEPPEALVARLGALPGVVRAERDPIAYGLAHEISLASRGAKRGFSDPSFASQWELARIRLPEARDVNSTDGEGVIVAVLDSGVAIGGGAAYPDRRGLDLAGIRLLPGLDLVSGGAPVDRGVALSSTSPVLFGHGTFAAAQIVAAVDNGIGGASIAPRATLLPVRVLGTSNFGLFSDIAAGIDFAVAQGAKVINMSLGGRAGAGFLEAAIDRAHRAGVVIVASAGNEANDPDPPSDVLFPARYPQVIAVGATAFDDTRAPYSNPGAGLDLVAPAGANSLREVAPGQRDAALAPSFLVDPRTGAATYSMFWATGTSFASPQVAGAAALLIALGIDDPDLVRALLVDNTVDRGPRGRDDETGAGRLELRRAHRGVGFSF